MPPLLGIKNEKITFRLYYLHLSLLMLQLMPNVLQNLNLMLYDKRLENNQTLDRYANYEGCLWNATGVVVCTGDENHVMAHGSLLA
ncbi:hypothetical protein [Klebsiella sp. LY]|uniref:hypothetical protein n=1 Tax=Klebsiella sp. LY TaxID=2015795 RepID=UPI0019D4DD26|nr:hypothetical protein [Klebsiella sp. LY]